LEELIRIAIIGSRALTVENLSAYIPDCNEIVSGGAKGIDTCVAEYARKNSIKLTEFLPNYQKYGRAAPIRRNEEIVDYADRVIAFWDGSSKGTMSVIKYAEKTGKECQVILCKR